jgi:hypothetical protein
LQAAGQSHEAMFDSGLNCDGNAAKAKCAAKPVVWSSTVGNGFGLGSSVGRARPW